jgi:putative phosphonate metabolism protein
MHPRYAVYFAPHDGSSLWQLGCSWLGRDPQRDCALEHPALPGFTCARIADLTAAPRMYGFHATLKPPFALAGGCAPDDLHDALAAFARRRAPFPLPPLEVGMLGGFIALRPAAASTALEALARDCVLELDRWRAPPDPEELARRRAAGLSARQEAMLARYGYPYVLDEFRFHLTLTDRVPAHEAQPLRELLAGHFTDALRESLAVDSICLFVEERPGVPFRLARRHDFLAVSRS